MAFLREQILTDISDLTLNCFVFSKDRSTKQSRQLTWKEKFLLQVLSETQQLQNEVFMQWKTKKRCFPVGKKCLELRLRVKNWTGSALCQACNTLLRFSDLVRTIQVSWTATHAAAAPPLFMRPKNNSHRHVQQAQDQRETHHRLCTRSSFISAENNADSYVTDVRTTLTDFWLRSWISFFTVSSKWDIARGD